MEKLNKITVPAGQKFRQLQKIVYDIKKNDSGIMSKFKKLTSKPPPSPPPIDYVAGHAEEEEQWSDDFDSDYENPDDHSDSEMYVIPSEENGDDSYEPPPSEHEKKMIPEAFSFPREEYADHRSIQQAPRPIAKPLPILPSQSSSKPKKLATLPPPTAVVRPNIPPKPKEHAVDEADYVVPVDDDDSYIEPTEASPSQPVRPPVVNRAIKPITKPDLPSSSVLPAAPMSPSMLDVYEVPEEEEKSSPLLTSRISKPLPPKPAQRPGGHFNTLNQGKESVKSDMPRNVLPLPRKHPPPKVESESFEIQDEENHKSNVAQEFRLPLVTIPSPCPRIKKKPQNPPPPSVSYRSVAGEEKIPPMKPSMPDRDHLTINEDKPIPAERRRGSSQDLPLPPIPSHVPKSLPQKPLILPRSSDSMNRTIGTLCNSVSGGLTMAAEQDADVHGKAWYAASSDRKTAEDALYKSNKDGSFLVRKSSGQDSKQPYTLVVFYNKRVYNIPVRFIEATRQYALGREKSGEERFNSVAEIIENHQRISLVLIDSQSNTKDSTKLIHITRIS